MQNVFPPEIPACNNNATGCKVRIYGYGNHCWIYIAFVHAHY